MLGHGLRQALRVADLGLVRRFYAHRDNPKQTMKPDSSFKLYRGVRLPGFEYPLVLVTRDVHNHQFACSEYHIIVPSRAEVESSRLSVRQDLDELPQALISLDGIVAMQVEAAHAWIESYMSQSIEQSERIHFFLQRQSELHEIDQRELVTFRLRGRLQPQFDHIRRTSRSSSLREFLRQVADLPTLDVTDEHPIPLHNIT